MDALKKDSFIAAHLALRRAVHVGGCPRLYEGCPVGWISSNGSCSPGSGYDGFCGPRNFGTMTKAQKEDFAFKCGSSWPCVDSTSSVSASCPAGWKSTESGCVAPSSYSGMCSPTTNFNGWSAEAKARWAAMCGSPF